MSTGILLCMDVKGTLLTQYSESAKIYLPDLFGSCKWWWNNIERENPEGSAKKTYKRYN